MTRGVIRAYEGWPIPELLAGTLVGGLFSVTVGAVLGLDLVFPLGAIAAAGAITGAALSWVWRPRAIALDARRLSPEQEHLSRAA